MTYAGAHDCDDVDSANWTLHREWVLAREVHPLSVRRAETTRIALQDLETPSHHLRLALGIAAGALLAAGTFIASSLGGASEDANTAALVPEHTFASLEQRLSVTEAPAEAPAPVPGPVAETPAPAPVNEQTEPASTDQQADAVVAQDHAAGRGENQHRDNTPAPAPAPAQNQQSGQWGSAPQWGSGSQWGSGGQWGSAPQWGSTPQWGYGAQWGYGTQQWSPVGGFGAPTPSSYSAAASTPTGPAMSMLNPFCPMG